MDPIIQQLREEFRKMRDESIRYAHAQYREALKEISAIHKRMNMRYEGRFKKTVYQHLGLEMDGGDCANMTTVEASYLVLQEGKPLSLKELVVEVHSRGCRPHSSISSLTNAIRAGLQYHTDRFRLNKDGKWELVK